MDISNHAQIINDWAVEPALTNLCNTVPNGLALLMAAVFGLSLWWVSRVVKRLRIQEYDLYNDNKNLNRQVERDGLVIKSLTDTIEHNNALIGDLRSRLHELETKDSS